MTQAYQKHTTLANLEAKEIESKCEECKDSGWILGDNGYKRCKCYKKDYAQRLWNHFGVKSDDVKKLKGYIPIDEISKSAKEKALNYIKGFDELKGSRENSFGLFGQSGAGKTHIIVAIGAALLNREPEPVPVIYMPYLEAMRELKANTLDDENYLHISSRYQKARLLIIDDLFKDKIKKGKLIKDKYGEIAGLNEADMKHIYPILNYRYLNYLPTLISTECTPNMLLDLDEALAGRILESCGNNITVFQGRQYNYRMRKFMK